MEQGKGAIQREEKKKKEYFMLAVGGANWLDYGMLYVND